MAELDDVVSELLSGEQLQDPQEDLNLNSVVDEMLSEPETLEESVNKQQVLEEIDPFDPPSPTVEGLKQAGKDIGKTALEAGIGVVKGLGSTGRSMLQIADRAQKTIATFDPKTKMVRGFQDKLQERVGLSDYITSILASDDTFKPKGAAQKTGFMAEQIGELLLPSSATLKLQKAASGAIRGAGKLSKLARFLSKPAIEGLVSGGARGLQTDLAIDEMKQAAIFSSMIPLTGKVLAKTGKATLKKFKDVGESILADKIGLNKLAMKEGAKVSNMVKHDLIGDVSEVVFKSQKKLADLHGKLSNIIKSSKEKINITKVFDDVEDDLVKELKKFKHLEDDKTISKKLYDLYDNITKRTNQRDVIDLAEAQLLKQEVGREGAWAFGREPKDAKAVEVVYNKVYDKLKTAIEKTSPSGAIKQLNKQMSEIIPIERAALRAIPKEIKEAHKIKDVVGLAISMWQPKYAILVGAQKALRSPTTSKVLTKTADWLEDFITPMTQNDIAKRIFQ